MDDRSLYERNKTFAQEKLGLRDWLYYSSGTDNEETLRANEAAYRKLLLVPRVLRAAPEVTLRTRLLGREVAMPIGICPTAYHQVLHPDGELATARAAAEMDVCYTQSFYSNRSLEEVSEAHPGLFRWLNIRSIKQRALLVQVIQRAERCGYSAFVLTVDTPKFGNKLSTKRIPFKLPRHLKSGILPLSPPDAKPEERTIDPDLVTWEEISWVKSLTKLPIILKGILTAEDARLAVLHGVAAIQVSNHGGRGLNYSPATLEALAEISEAVGGDIDLFVDGGVRTGADVLKALALGAKAVFLGRPVLFGLHYAGCDGIIEVLQTMREQLILAMQSTGCSDVNAVPRNVVRKRPLAQL